MVIHLPATTDDALLNPERLTPKEIVRELDKYIVGQNAAPRGNPWPGVRRRRDYGRFVVAAAVILLIASTAPLSARDRSPQTEDFRPPDVLRYQRPDVVEPVWVSQSAALDQQGELRFNLFAEHLAADLRRHLDRNRDGNCHEALGHPIPLAAWPDHSLGEVVANAHLIVAATVTGITRGFHHGHAGSLLTLSTIERVKETVPLSNEDTLFLFYPGTKIRTSSGIICSVASPSAPSTPDIGDRVVVFMFGQPVDEQQRVISASFAERHIVIEREGSGRVVPNHLTHDLGANVDVDGLIQAVRRYLESL
jgi:hypothetical protein